MLYQWVRQLFNWLLNQTKDKQKVSSNNFGQNVCSSHVYKFMCQDTQPNESTTTKNVLRKMSFIKISNTQK